MHAIQFGAGNIGRGFIGKILADAGWSVTFADVNETVVGLLARDRRYPVDVVGDGAHRDEVTGVDAVSASGDAVVALIATTDLVTTAVGPAVLPRLAPTLARGLAARHAAGTTTPLNVIACENKVRATSDLKAAVLPLLSPEVRAYVDANVGFADSAVDRIVPPAPPVEGEPLAVTVEAFSEWIVDGGQLVGWTADVPGMELTDTLMAFVERKLFTLNTGHAITAYLGFLAGAATIRDAIETPAIRATVRAAMEESGAVLIRRYGFDPARHAAYIDKILARFANPHLVDEVARVGREPLRKLGKGDRLIRPLLGTIDYGLPNGALIEGIAAALAYRNDTDPQAVELATLLAAGGVAAVLEKTAEAALPVEVIAAVAAAYERIKPA